MDAFSSKGFQVAGVGKFEPAHVAVLTLGPDGLIGRHPAVGEQLLVVLTGSARVSGADGATAIVSPGRAVLWHADEEHETEAGSEGLTALVVEGPFEPAPGLR
ncbi:hypothetical protein VV02_13630 [Luteipulveratus mongoliensis]|uniref:Cupin 2 conserved barrel domain-containing protein n=1 Tax=Luteipulveratus mongoliensis TaxID=571913 RepID=A0A0K1JQA7_9MICO|nr:hypothetical protein VV02_13630 [Luteipulveratus mongoliensis]